MSRVAFIRCFWAICLLGPIGFGQAQTAAHKPPLTSKFVEPPLPPGQFNPDPGGVDQQGPEPGPIPLFLNDPTPPADYGTDAVPKRLSLPREELDDIVPLEKTFQ